MPQCRSVATVNPRAARTELVSAVGVRLAIREEHVQPLAPGSGASGQFPLARAAISTADVNQCQPTPPAALLTKGNGFAVIAFRTISSRTVGNGAYSPIVP
jgi:hypothetical protein